MSTPPARSTTSAMDRIIGWPTVGPLIGRLRSVWLLESLDFGRFPGRLWAPVIVAVLGASTFALLRVDMVWIYTESTAFLVLAVAIGFVCRSTGLAFVGAFVFADLTREILAPPPDDPQPIGRVISYVLLWILVVYVPHQARRGEALIAAGASRRGLRPLPARLTGGALAALLSGLMVYLWANTSAYLIRPVFPVEPYPLALVPLQDGSVLLGGAAALVAFAYSIRLRRRAIGDADAIDLAPSAAHRGWRAIVIRGVGIVVALILLAGLITGPLDVALLGGALVIGQVIPGIVARAPRVGRALTRVPIVVRFLCGVGVTFAVAQVVSLNFYQPAFGSEFFPLVVPLAFGIVTFHLLMVSRRSDVRPAGPPATPAARATTGLVVAIASSAAISAMLTLPGPAFADNCSGLSDCASGAAAWLSGSLAAIVAFLWAWIQGVFAKTPPVVGDLSGLLSEEGAQAQLATLEMLKDKVAANYMAQTGDTDGYYQIKGMSDQEFAKEAQTGKWNAYYGSGGGQSIAVIH